MTLNVVGGTSSLTDQSSAAPPTQTTTSDDRVSIQPIVRGGTERATYVNTTALAAAMGAEDIVSRPTWSSASDSFEGAWTTMHHQLDLAPIGHSTGLGSEAHAISLALDPVAMLAGAENLNLAHERRVAPMSNSRPA